MKTIIELYEEANGWNPAGFDRTVQDLERFARLVRADEFEKCAKVCDARVMGDNNREDMEAKRCAADIRSFRARGNT
jgi:hypothetical protein